MKIKGREIAAFLLWVPVAIAFTITYLVFITKILDKNLGMAGGAYVIVLPLALLFFAIVIWLPFFIWRRKNLRAKLGLTGALMAAGICAVVTFPFCATSCFDGVGSDAWLAEAGMIFAFVGALLHDATSAAFLDQDRG